MDADELLAQARGVVLDFDGPMAALMPAPANRAVADAVRPAVHEPLPSELAVTADHVAVLRHVVARSRGVTPELEAVHRAAERAELECARRCERAPWLTELLTELAASGRPWAVATNNAPSAVQAFLERHDIPAPVAIEGRTLATAGLLKPHPDLVRRAAERLGVDVCRVVFVGDSVSDMTAGIAAGVRVLGYAKDATRARALTVAGAAAIVVV